MDKQYFISIIWLSGFLISNWMLKVEHKAEGNELTNGNRVSGVLLSVFSFGTVLFILVSAWVGKVSLYWKQTKTKKPK